ncbi:hypothetical protein [Anaerovorax sp. IOR16]|uniref:hypothetical protein n=1 Tax=Anaerovorax sp. IOR16 TaxID=2773458 RepID=UPI001FD69498|nr:hypothetical protein [Anaerovorax sp. IOR16]
MDRNWKLGDDLNVCDNVLDNITFGDLILMAQNINPSSGRTLQSEFEELLQEKISEAREMFESNYEEIMSAAFPEEEQKSFRLSEEEIEKLVYEIRQLLLEKEMWTDVCIYFNGKRMTTHDAETNKYYYNDKDKIIIEENKEASDYFDYAGGCLSMSFEGDFYEVLNGYLGEYGCRIEGEFRSLLSKYGLYYELGNAWNLSCYDN